MTNDLTTSAQALDKTISTIVMNGNTYTPDELGKVDVGEISSGGSIDFVNGDLQSYPLSVSSNTVASSAIAIYGVKKDLSNLPEISVYFNTETIGVGTASAQAGASDFHSSLLGTKIANYDSEFGEYKIDKTALKSAISIGQKYTPVDVSGGSISNVSCVYITNSGTISSLSFNKYTFHISLEYDTDLSALRVSTTFYLTSGSGSSMIYAKLRAVSVGLQ